MSVRKIPILCSILACMAFTVPTASAQWSQTSGPSLGHVNQFSLRGDTIYAAMGDFSIGALLRSVDSGKNWKWLSNHIPNKLDMQAVAHDGVMLYAGTRNGLFISSDEGGSWKLSMASISAQHLVVYGGGVYVAGALTGGVARTTDHGATWQSVSKGMPGNTNIRIIFPDGPRLFAGSNTGGLWVSTDTAKSWQSVAGGFPQANAYVYAMGRADSVLLVSTPQQLYRSTDQGATWSLVSTGLPSGSGIGAFCYTSGTLIGGVSGYGDYRSTNLGSTWSRINPTVNTAANDIVHIGSTFIEGAFGVFRSSDLGTTWTRSDRYVGGTTITGLLQLGNDVFAGNLDADFGLIWLTSDAGYTWQSSSTNLSTIGVNAIAQPQGPTLVGTDGSGIFGSNNFGATWIQNTTFPVNGYVSAIGAHNSIALAGTTGGSSMLYRSVDGGVTWAPVTGLTIISNLTSILYTGTEWIASFGADGLYRSLDSGATWSKITTPNLFTQLLGVNANVIYAGDYKKLYRSADHGQTWTADSTILGAHRPLCMLSVNEKIYIGTDSGVYYSNDFGHTFTLNSGSELSTFQINALTMDAHHVYAGTTGSGVWVMATDESSVASHAIAAESSVRAFPNPAIAGLVQIEFASQRTGMVRCELVNELGQLMRTTTAFATASSHEQVALDIAGLKSGVYLCRIIDGTTVRSTKVMIAR